MHISAKRIACSRTLLLIGLLLAALTLWLGQGGCRQAKPPQTAKVTVGIQVSPAMTLVMVAKDRGFFEREKLDVELKEFTAGKFALQAFLGGSLDFVVSGEVPVCLATLQGNKLRVVCQVVERTVNEVRVVARRDGTETAGPKAYFSAKKRKLATSFGGGPEFYTYSFLRHFGIDTATVEIVSQRPEDMPAAIQSGSVDAVAVFDPFAFLAEKGLGEQGVTFTDPALYSEFYVLSARPEQIENSPDTIKAMIRALGAAEEFIANDPEAAKQIMARYTKLERPVVDGIWGNFVFRPALTAQLIDTWNAQAAWARKTKKVPAEAAAPDFRRIIEDRFLKEAKPDAVRLDSNKP